MIPKILTIAGSDAGGGAGIQADLKTFQEFYTFGISAITSIVSFNPENLGTELYFMPEDIVKRQLNTGFSADVLDAVKIGMIGADENILFIEEHLKKTPPKHLVIDPVMAVKSTPHLFQSTTVDSLVSRLFPLATVVTPNLVEAQVLAKMEKIETIDQLKEAAKLIHDLGPKYVIITGGGRFPGELAVDILYDGHTFELLESDKINTEATHGAGCSFAAAVTAGLAKNQDLKQVTIDAKHYVREGIKHGLHLNEHVGYLWHGAYREDTQKERFNHDSI